MQNLVNKTFFSLLAIIFLLAFPYSCSQHNNIPINKVKAQFNVDLVMLQRMISDSLLIEVRKSKDVNLMKKHFLNCRKQYKRVEYFSEYFYGATARLVNGAPIDEIELGENMVIPPGGFQVIEGLLYGKLTQEDRINLIDEVTSIAVPIKRMLMLNAELENNDAQIFDALRLELFRITALGLSGFDTPVSMRPLPEIAASLANMETVLGIYGKIPQPLGIKLTQSIDYLKGKNFNNFNQLDFIINFIQPLSIGIDNYRKDLKIESLTSETVLNEGVTQLFQKNAFNVNSFLGNQTQFINKEKINLGRALFNDVILSKDGNRSCTSCHHTDKAFTDGLKTPESLSKGKNLKRNTPTLTYAGYQNAFFYDLNSSSLEDQSLAVMQNPDEMHGSIANSIVKLNKVKSYLDLIKKAFPKDTTQATPFKIENALSSYVRSLGNFSSRFDLYMQGEKKQLSANEKNGFNLFMGKGKCGSCHFLPLFNGTAPPRFNTTEAEVLGVPTKAVLSNASINEDLGRFGLNPYPQYKYAFKTPTLRNISKTAPYMHNGVYQTLEQVVDFYNNGGGNGIGLNLPNQTLSSDSLNLSPQEKQNIIAFMQTLTDNTAGEKYPSKKKSRK